jgi:hypothetical protein
MKARLVDAAAHASRDCEGDQTNNHPAKGDLHGSLLLHRPDARTR